MESWMVDLLLFSYHVRSHHFPCMLRELRVPLLLLGICQESGASSKSGQDDAKGHLGAERKYWPRLLRSVVFGAERGEGYGL